jgi:hypothetical protein
VSASIKFIAGLVHDSRHLISMSAFNNTSHSRPSFELFSFIFSFLLLLLLFFFFLNDGKLPKALNCVFLAQHNNVNFMGVSFGTVIMRNLKL